MGRIQWNFLGRDVPFSQSDPEYTPLPIGSIAFAGAHNRTDRIVFPGSRNEYSFVVVDGQFEVDQGNARVRLQVERALHPRGVSCEEGDR